MGGIVKLRNLALNSLTYVESETNPVTHQESRKYLSDEY
jgi:hypothetical protein